jgi:hypothetical protein
MNGAVRKRRVLGAITTLGMDGVPGLSQGPIKPGESF